MAEEQRTLRCSAACLHTVLLRSMKVHMRAYARRLFVALLAVGGTCSRPSQGDYHSASRGPSRWTLSCQQPRTLPLATTKPGCGQTNFSSVSCPVWSGVAANASRVYVFVLGFPFTGKRYVGQQAAAQQGQRSSSAAAQRRKQQQCRSWTLTPSLLQALPQLTFFWPQTHGSRRCAIRTYSLQTRRAGVRRSSSTRLRSPLSSS